MLRVVRAALAALLALGCANTESNTGPLGGSAGSGVVNGSGGGGGSLTIDATAPDSSFDCLQATQYIYVISNGALYRFDPLVASPSSFTFVGQVDVPGSIASLSVDRSGRGWVLKGLDDTSLATKFACHGVTLISVETAVDITEAPFVCGSAGFHKFGMGFVSDEAGGATESLFLANAIIPALGRLEPSGNVQYVAPLTGAAELTGNANGELWGFFPGDPVPPEPTHVRRIDKETGATLTDLSLAEIKSGAALPEAGPGMPPPGLGSSRNYAFAFWGGDFYVFYEIVGEQTSTDVWKVSPTGQVSELVQGTGLHVVGAGVSTCAPLSTPI